MNQTFGLVNEVFGLPAHPLLVHVPVVLIPLAFIGLILITVRPKLKSSLLLPTAAVGIVGVLGAILASEAGEWLQARVDESNLIEQHAELGEMSVNLSIAFGLVLVLLAARYLLVERKLTGENAVTKILSPAWVGMAATVGALLFGALATTWLVRTGDSGAKSVWDGKVSATPRPGAEE